MFFVKRSRKYYPFFVLPGILKLTFFLVVLTGWGLQSGAQGFHSMSASFELSIQATTASQASGRLYFLAPDRLLLQVEEPVQQVMLYEDGSMRMYYPQSGRSIRFEDSPLEGLVFFGAFLRATARHGDPSADGFELAGSRFAGDSLYITYRPPEGVRTHVTEMRSVFAEDRLIYSLVTDKEDALMARTDYGAYETHGLLMIPTSVRVRMFEQGVCTYEEKASFTDVKVNAAFDLRELIPPAIRQ